MIASAWNEFEQRLACEDSWHADSQPLAWPVPDALAQRLAERNTAALASVAALEERRAENADDDSPVMQELLRLDAKLNALIDMINRVALPADALPPRQPLRFNAIGAVLPAALVQSGESLLLRLRFDHRLESAIGEIRLRLATQHSAKWVIHAIDAVRRDGLEISERIERVPPLVVRNIELLHTGDVFAP